MHYKCGSCDLMTISSCSYHLMQNCWKGFASDRSHFEKILSVLDNYLTRLRRPDSVYNSDTESDEDAESNHQRQNSGKPPARTPSIRSGECIYSGTSDKGPSEKRTASLERTVHNVIFRPLGIGQPLSIYTQWKWLVPKCP